MLQKLSWIILWTCFLMAGCKTQQEYSPADASPITHEAFTSLLQKHVDENGNVNYKGFQEDQKAFTQYLKKLSNHPPNDTWSREEKLAYWINAYNAFTVKLIVDHYPLESIQDLHPTIKIPTVSTVWHKKFFKIGGVETSLNEIEHEILRKKFDEPRIHFAINCASVSCAPLRSKAYTAANLDQELTTQAQNFLSDASKNNISKDRVVLSKIFRWFKGDFSENGSLIEYINQYTKTNIHPDAEIEYMEYNWSLNEQ